MKILGLEDVNIEKIEQKDDRVTLYISLPVKPHCCPARLYAFQKVVKTFKHWETDI